MTHRPSVRTLRTLRSSPSVTLARHALLEFAAEHLLPVFVGFELAADHELAFGACDVRAALRPDAPVLALEFPRPRDFGARRKRIVLDDAVALGRARFGDEIDVVIAIAAAAVGDLDDRLAFTEIRADGAIAASG